MGCNGMTRLRNTSTNSSVMCRKLRRLRVTVIFYTCGSLCAILLLVNFNEDVKKLLQQSQYNGAPHEQSSLESAPTNPRELVAPSGKSNVSPTRRDINFLSGGSIDRTYQQQQLLQQQQQQQQQQNQQQQQQLSYENQRPWFMSRVSKYPDHPLPSLYSSYISATNYQGKLWPEEDPASDRIVQQLMYVIDDSSSNTSPNSSADDRPSSSLVVGTNRWNYKELVDNELTPSRTELSGRSSSSGGSSGNVNNNFNSSRPNITKMKTILLYYGLGMSWGSHVTSGRNVFLQQKCPVNACRLTGNRAHLNKADVVVFKDVFMNPKVRRQSHQLWVMYMLECPLNTQNFIEKNVFNMTATYRHDSDIVTPYEKWIYHNEHVKSLPQKINYAEGKSKKVAWFVSNCVAKNNRLEFARELGKYIEVDIYGACGSHSCSRANAKQCFDLLSKHYKFYLAFENSNCRDYISEKFFVNGLGNNVLPIVMGAHPDDYKRVAPEKSYIHVDDFASPKELAQYLNKLDADEDLYNEYFLWKGTGEFVNTHFFCRLCAMSHYADRSDHKNRYYEDFNKWWRGPNVCTRRSWRNQPDIFATDYTDKQTTNHENV